MHTRDNGLICMIHTWQTLMEMEPSSNEFAAWSSHNILHGPCVTRRMLWPSGYVHSRLFWLVVGIVEDLMTGSVCGTFTVCRPVNGLVGNTTSHSGLCSVRGRSNGRAGRVRTLVELTAQDPSRENHRAVLHNLRGEVCVPA
jgi:predicted PhzF superfamily epimerase YddE/YHI9